MKALLIGINSYPLLKNKDLSGCVNDVHLIKNLLTTIFTVPESKIQILTDETAEKPTRDNILKRLEQLAADVDQEELIFIHYSGHGSRLIDKSKLSNFCETMVPCDSGRSPPDEPNRDITDVQLSEILQKLAGKTSNIVLNFDCCHSGHITRDDQNCAQSRCVEADYTDFIDVLQVERKAMENVEPCGGGGWFSLGKAYTLLAACKAEESAFESPHPFFPGQKSGIWTCTLYQTIVGLSSSKLRNFTYRKVLECCSSLVSAAFPKQHPLVEGNLDREFLGSTLHPVIRTPKILEVKKEKSTVKLSAGASFGLAIGMEIAVCSDDVDLSEDIIQKNKIITTGTIKSVDFGESMAKLESCQSVEVGLPVTLMSDSGKSLKTLVEIKDFTTSSNAELDVFERMIFDHISNNPFLSSCKEAREMVGEQHKVTIAMVDPKFKPSKSNITHTILKNCPFKEPVFLVFGPENELEIQKPIPVTESGTKILLRKLDDLALFYRGLGIVNLLDPHLAGKVDFDILCHPHNGSHWSKFDGESGGGRFEEGWEIGVKLKNSSLFPLYVGLLEYAENGEVHLLYPPEGAEEQLAAGQESEEIHIGEMGEVHSNTPSPVEIFKLFASRKPADFGLLTNPSGFRGCGSWIHQLGDSLSSAIAALGYRLVKKSASHDDCWITVQKQFTLGRSDKVHQLLLDYFHFNSFLGPETFLNKLYHLHTLSCNVDDVVEKLKNFVQKTVDPIHVFHKVLNLHHILTENISSEVQQFHMAVCLTVLETLLPLLQPLQQHFLENHLCLSKLIELHIKTPEKARTYLDFHIRLLECGQYFAMPVDQLMEMGHHFVSLLRDVKRSLGFVPLKYAVSVFLTSSKLFQEKKDVLSQLQCLKLTSGLLSDRRFHMYSESENQEVMSLMVEAHKAIKNCLGSLTAADITVEEVAELCLVLIKECRRLTINAYTVQQPWGPDAIHACEIALESGAIISDEHKVECHQLLGYACLRTGEARGLVDSKLMKKGIKNLLEAYRYQTHSTEKAYMAIDLAEALANFESLYPFTKELEEWKSTVVQILNGIITNQKVIETMDPIFGMAMDKLLDLQQLPTLDQLDIGVEVAEHAHDQNLTLGKIHAGIGQNYLKLLNSTLSEKHKEMLNITVIDNNKHILLFLPRLASVSCSAGPNCPLHNDKVIWHFERAIELLDSYNYQTQICIFLARYYATHCEMTATRRMERAIVFLEHGIKQHLLSIPNQNATIQIYYTNRTGLPLWEDTIDVCLTSFDLSQDRKHLKLILAIFDIAKSRNVLLASAIGDVDFTVHSGTLSDELSYTFNIGYNHPISDFQESASENLFQLQQNTLRDGEAVIHWWVSAKGFVLCLIYSKFVDPHIFHIWSIDDTVNLLQLCKDFTSSGYFSRKHLQGISEAFLLSEMVEFIKTNMPHTTKLILVPHVLLHYIPFHLLPLTKSANPKILLSEFSDGVTLIPNAKLLEKRLQVTSSHNQIAKMKIFHADPMLDLSHSLNEVQKIQEIGAKSTEETDVKVFEEASGDEFLEEIKSSPDYLHIACHGDWNSVDANKSLLKLQDRDVYLSELRVILSSCKLAVLSACNSGLVDLAMSGFTDIYVGFGGQLLANGCRNVILSLAPVPDQLTSNVMSRLYRKLLIEKKTISKSLAEALLDENSAVGKEIEDEDRLVKKIHAATDEKNNVVLPFVHIGID